MNVVGSLQGHAQEETLRERATAFAARCAEARQVPPEQFLEWLTAQRLHEPEYLIPRLNAALAALIPADAWLFDPNEAPPLRAPGEAEDDASE